MYIGHKTSVLFSPSRLVIQHIIWVFDQPDHYFCLEFMRSIIHQGWEGQVLPCYLAWATACRERACSVAWRCLVFKRSTGTQASKRHLTDRVPFLPWKIQILIHSDATRKLSRESEKCLCEVFPQLWCILLWENRRIAFWLTPPPQQNYNMPVWCCIKIYFWVFMRCR